MEAIKKVILSNKSVTIVTDTNSITVSRSFLESLFKYENGRPDSANLNFSMGCEDCGSNQKRTEPA